MDLGEERLPVFVYGTLRPGQKNFSSYLAGRTVGVRAGTVKGELYFVAEGGYPYLLPGEGRVVGELVDIVPEHYTEVLRSLDRLEEYDGRDENNSVYLRRRTTVNLDSGEGVAAWVYYWNCPRISGARIESGDFNDRRP